MKLIENFQKKKFLLFNIFFTLYIGINLIGGDRGLLSYFDKKETFQELVKKENRLTVELKDLNHKILLINKNDPDYLDMLYREKFKYGTNDEIIIKLK
jgi:cell division protein DivIC|tara:strand:- start:2233 stop:2526 length:294 start_codon:yes stop_codon:yes gene_type:complete